MKGLEPSTFCMASRRSSQLSYIRASRSIARLQALPTRFGHPDAQDPPDAPKPFAGTAVKAPCPEHDDSCWRRDNAPRPFVKLESATLAGDASVA
jgi:hypothetical protein